jgi:isopenicillin N synthase-like dioxygenase
MYVAKVDFRDKDAAKQFADSLRDTGFAVITDHPLDMKLVADVFKEWEGFFASEDKYNYRFNPMLQDGYYPMDVAEKAKGYDVLDIKEFYHYYPWGQYPNGLSDKTRQLYEQMNKVAVTLLGWVEANTPADIVAQLSEPLSHMIKDSPNTTLRILHYPPLTGTEAQGAIRAADHEDINLLTILPAATSPGLQVKDKQGNWHDVPCDPGSIVVNSGDMLQECTRGYYKATTHRVCNPMDATANQSRLSMPLFLHPRDEVVLSERYTRLSYLTERLKELGTL